jgi:hypothetical protein
MYTLSHSGLVARGQRDEVIETISTMPNFIQVGRVLVYDGDALVG